MTTKKFSNKQEQLVANLLGWGVVPASGARDFNPGDIRSNQWLGECKTHVSAGTSVKFFLDVWKKISEEAKQTFKFPVYISDDGSQRIKRTWCLFDPSKVTSSDARYSLATEIVGRKSISFDHDDMITKYRSNVLEFGENFCFRVSLGSASLSLTTLETFARLFGVNG